MMRKAKRLARELGFVSVEDVPLSSGGVAYLMVGEAGARVGIPQYLVPTDGALMLASEAETMRIMGEAE